MVSSLARVIAVVAVLVCFGAVAATSSARPQTVHIDRRTDPNESGEYYVALVARSGGPAGHAYVNLFGRDEQRQVSFDEAFGLYPAEEPSLWRLTKVPGKVIREDRASQDAARIRLVVRVNRQTMQRVREFRDNFVAACNKDACEWQLLVGDCVTFMRDAARLAGLQIPPRYLDSPFTAVVELINVNH